jgi:hypothetical protein
MNHLEEFGAARYYGIWECILNSTPVHPVRLVGFINHVYTTRMSLISKKELAAGLQELIEAGYAAELRPHIYYDATGKPVSKTFSGISDEAYDEAIELLRKLGRWPDPCS